MEKMTAAMNVFTLVIVFTAFMASASASKNRDESQDADNVYDGAMKWAASIGPFSKGEGDGLRLDLHCNAGENCRDGMSKAIGKAKDTVAETHEAVCKAVHAQKDGAVKTGGDVFTKAKKVASEEAVEVKEKVSETAHGVHDAIHGAFGWMREGAREVGDAVGDVVGRVKEMASEKAGHQKEAISRMAQQACRIASIGYKVAKEQGKETVRKAKVAKDTATTVANHISGNVSESMRRRPKWWSGSPK